LYLNIVNIVWKEEEHRTRQKGGRQRNTEK
jgi:hypothetical protein